MLANHSVNNLLNDTLILFRKLSFFGILKDLLKRLNTTLA